MYIYHIFKAPVLLRIESTIKNHQKPNILYHWLNWSLSKDYLNYIASTLLKIKFSKTFLWFHSS